MARRRFTVFVCVMLVCSLVVGKRVRHLEHNSPLLSEDHSNTPKGKKVEAALKLNSAYSVQGHFEDLYNAQAWGPAGM